MECFPTLVKTTLFSEPLVGAASDAFTKVGKNRKTTFYPPPASHWPIHLYISHNIHLSMTNISKPMRRAYRIVTCAFCGWRGDELDTDDICPPGVLCPKCGRNKMRGE
jgi:hypothetical protein